MIVSNPNEDDEKEIERINKKKAEEILALQQKKVMLQSQHGVQNKPILLTDSNFSSEVSKNNVMVVDFWAAWCGPCRMVGPVIEQLANEYAGKVTFGKLNVDENPAVSQNFGIQSIPTILVFHKGKRVDGLLGAVPKAYIESKFKPYLEEKTSFYSVH
jgi:thioredoxin 1